MTRRSWVVDVGSIYCRVETTKIRGAEVITSAAPVLRRFVGQPLSNLQRWVYSKRGMTSPLDEAVDVHCSDS